MDKRFQCVFNQSRFIQMLYKDQSHRVKFMDTLNIFNTSLEKVGKDLLHIKGKTPEKFKLSSEDLETIQSGKFSNDELKEIYNISEETINKVKGDNLDYNITDEDIEYCARDCEIVLKVVQLFSNFLFQYGVNMSSTIASIALRLYLTNFLDHEIKVSGYDGFFRNSYFGGRVEVFKGRKTWVDNVYYYDFNSLYPSVMFEAQYPDPETLKYQPFSSVEYIKKYEGVSECTVYVPKDVKIPPLPYRHGGKLLFPVGTLTGWWNHNELRNAISYGVKILKVHKTVYAKETISPFRDFVHHFYTMRKKYKEEKNVTGALFTKYILNSLYGKFGQRIRKTKFGWITEEHEGWTFEPIEEDSDFGIWRKCKTFDFVLGKLCNQLCAYQAI